MGEKKQSMRSVCEKTKTEDREKLDGGKTSTNPVQILAQLNSLLMKIKAEKLVTQKLDIGTNMAVEKWEKYDAKFAGLIEELRGVYTQLKG